LKGVASIASGILLIIGSWLVPGLGFIVKRNYWRGVAVFVILNGTFFFGMLLHGTVLIPEFHYSSPSFNIVNVLMFIGQMGNGAASLFCIGRDHWQWSVLTPVETNPLFDLAMLYMLVSGCMNYFCICSLWDRQVGSMGEEDEQETSHRK